MVIIMWWWQWKRQLWWQLLSPVYYWLFSWCGQISDKDNVDDDDHDDYDYYDDDDDGNDDHLSIIDPDLGVTKPISVNVAQITNMAHL